MNLLDELKSLGVDVDEGLKHFRGNAVIFEKLIRKFPSSIEGLDVQSQIDKGDIKQAYMNAHSLKGVCANLYISPLYELYSQISSTLKNGETEGVGELLSKALPLQKKITDTIESA